MTRLIVVRHGNTFAPGEKPRRVGARTDLPLVDSGRQQAHRLGELFREKGIVISAAYCSELRRAIQTAEGILQASNLSLPIRRLSIFNEIDYGPDENRLEEEVVARLGQEAIDAWNQRAVVPEGWRVDPKALIESWRNFGQQMEKDRPGQTILVVTSNGVARFSPYLSGDFEAFARSVDSVKLKTGAYAIFLCEEGEWRVQVWNERPAGHITG